MYAYFVIQYIEECDELCIDSVAICNAVLTVISVIDYVGNIRN